MATKKTIESQEGLDETIDATNAPAPAKAKRGSKKVSKPVQKTLKVEEVKSTAKYIRISPLKLQRVANVVRGKSANTALFILKRLPHKGAKIIYEVLHSAVANAKHNHELENVALKLSTLQINEGPRLKRFQPKGRGRIYQILKRTSHVTVGLKAEEGVK
jgi:large subunit ribosomal protein L22